VGAFGAGLLVQLVPSPTDWVFGVLTVVFVLAAPGVLLLLPETSPRVPGARTSLRPRVEVARPQRPAFLLALPVVVAAWALGGLYASLGPSLVADVFGVDNHIAGGLLILALNGTGVFGSLAVRTVAPQKALVGGALTFVVGVVGTVTAVLTGSLVLLFVAAVVTGFAFGAAFFGAIAMVTDGVAPGHRAGLLAAVFVVGYLAFSLPAIAAGLAVPAIGLARATEIYGGVVIVLALVAVASVTLRARRSRRSAAAPAADSEPIAA
jgi:predicted MFS family arabinose efflux permease